MDEQNSGWVLKGVAWDGLRITGRIFLVTVA